MKKKEFLIVQQVSLMVLLVLMFGIDHSTSISPSIKGMVNLHKDLYEGEDLLLTCIVSNAGKSPVIWTKVFDGKKKIIAIDRIRVVTDPRVSILHDEAPKFNTSLIFAGGDVWVLSIKNVTMSDAGGYLCRVYSDPPAQSYYMLQVQSSEMSRKANKLVSTHNYTDCCLDANVDPQCLGYCSLHNIMLGQTGIQPEKCETEFPDIVRCMADFRDHTPCCEKQGIPAICQDLCRGQYTVQDDYVKSHFSCTTFTESTLMCISEGIQILPKAPSSPSVVVTGPNSIQVSWENPSLASPQFDHYVINVTTIARFDPPVDVTAELSENSSTIQDLAERDDLHFVVPKQMQIKVPNNVTTFQVESLSPLTWYEVGVSTINAFGASKSPYTIRVVTRTIGGSELATVPVNTELPDIVGCCIDKGVKHQRCLDNLCNPSKRYIEEPDLIVCAAWSNETFSCLINGEDHSDCCRRRGLPDLCVNLCTGNFTKIDYNYFKCVDYFSDYRSCLLEGYGVLPSSPTSIQVSNIQPTFALLSWGQPEKNAQSVTSYHAYYRAIGSTRKCREKESFIKSTTSYLGLHVSSPPQVIEGLCPDVKYEVYIEAFNAHGTSPPSNRILFRTPPETHPHPAAPLYNATQCCNTVNVSPGCVPLCGYNVRMSHYRVLATTCTPDMSKILRCIVGGRDHGACCAQRGVPVSCLSLCSGSFRAADRTPLGCLPYMGNIIMCLEEGVEVLPGPVTALHATQITESGLVLQWDPPKESNNVTHYEVHYQEVDKFSATHAVFKLNNTLNVTEPVAVLTDLKNETLYNMFVISVNDWGSSLPSSILTINVTKQRGSAKAQAGVPSAPHSLMLEGKTATSLTVLWQAPVVALPTDRIRYYLHYTSIPSRGKEAEYNVSTTSTTAMRLTSLTPNTQYIIYVTSMNDLGESRPSETLLAWTDPSYPAFVETPTVHPSNQIMEGGTMTILCIAMGSPSPNVSLYISGVLVHQDVTRHMVTIVKNVTRRMTEISCFADNGYGTPMQSTVAISISHRPNITANEDVKVVEGSEVTLKCLVEAWPEPKLLWWKDVANRIPVIHGGNTLLSSKNVTKGKYEMMLTMKSAQEAKYFCHASNTLGSFTHTVTVTTWEDIRQPLNVTSCCHANGVSENCVNACDFDQIDFHKEMNNDDCFADFGKLLYCGADHSDHRGCCSKKGVPELCLDWCRARPLTNEGEIQKCLLSWAPPIFDCFREGKESLPGPPENVVFKSLSSTTAELSWTPPVKNPQKVEMYRVFWRERGTKAALRNDTSSTSLRIHDLSEGVAYEVAVKAGNRKGTSVLTPTKIFSHTMPYVYILSQSGSNPAGIAVGVCLLIIFLGILSGFLYWGYKRRQLLSKGQSGISFENPSYVREQSGDAVQIAETPNGSLNGAFPTGNQQSSDPNVGHTDPDMPQNNGGSNGRIWNTGSYNIGTGSFNQNGPGFESDLDPKGGYRRFQS